GPLGIEFRTLLVEVGDLEPCALANGARIGSDITDQEAQQRGLPGTVRTDQADAIAAQYPLRVVANDDPVAERFADVIGFEDEPSRRVPGVDRHPDGTGLGP